jgi:hypothetical protein
MKNSPAGSPGVVSVAPQDTSSFMSTDSQGRLWISTREFLTKQGKFIPSEHLMRAWNKLAKGEGLDWLEEYSIESLWHEITHNRQVYRNLGGENTGKRRIAEIVTQWTARRTYPEFLQALGGNAAHLDSIKSEGLGYKLWVSKFDRLLSILKIDETEMLAEMKRLIDNVPRDKYEVELRKFFNGKSGVGKAQLMKAFGAIKYDQVHFENILKEIGLIN